MASTSPVIECSGGLRESRVAGRETGKRITRTLDLRVVLVKANGVQPVADGELVPVQNCGQ